jgi:hypothetical protein
MMASWRDFPPALFNGEDRWLELGVRSKGIANAITVLNLRTRLASTPHAVYVAKAGWLSEDVSVPTPIPDAQPPDARVHSTGFLCFTPRPAVVGHRFRLAATTVSGTISASTCNVRR